MKIEFDKLLTNYNSDLVTKLRGFNDEHDYLQYWVPGSDKSKSLINLIEALFEANVFTFSIIILKEDKYLIDTIKSISQRISKLKISEDEKKYEVSIILDKLKYKSFTEKRTKPNQIKKDNSVKLNQLNNDRKNYDILKNYEINLTNHNLNLNIKKNESDENIFFEFINENHKIYLKINKETKIISECWHDFKEKNNVSVVVDKFCQIILNKSIQEAAEHGTIYLEYSIRPGDKGQNIKGIILPKQVGGIFFDLHNCINKIYIKIKQKYNFQDAINKEYSDSSKEWLDVSEEKKLFKLNKCLSEKIIPILKLKKDDIIVHGIEHSNRIVIKISKDLEKKNSDEVNYIIKIENLFKHYIDNRLELFVLEKKDANKLRLSKSPQKI